MAESRISVAREPSSVETELKLSSTSSAPLRRLAAQDALGTRSLGAPQTFLEIDRYLDTAQGRLASQRWACRLRQRSGTYRVSLKGPPVNSHELGGALHRRPEVEGPASAGLDPGAWPASRARDLVLELCEGDPLEERFVLRQRRTQRSVHEDGAQIGTLSLDSVVVVGGGIAVGRLWCVELELDASKAVGDAIVSAMLADLLRAGSLTVEPLTKLERALSLLDLGRR